MMLTVRSYCNLERQNAAHGGIKRDRITGTGLDPDISGGLWMADRRQNRQVVTRKSNGVANVQFPSKRGAFNVRSAFVAS